MLVPVLFTAALVVLLLLAEQRGSAPGKWLTKPLASVGFLWTALQAGALSSTYGKVVLGALLLCLLGDVLLIPKDKRIFMAGIGAFLLGHLGFGAAFLVRGVAAPPTLIAGALLAPGVIWVALWLSPHLRGPMRVAVTAYVLVISGMVALATGTFGHTLDPRILVGAVLFFLSDLCVARNRFVAPGFANRLVGLPLYYAAQLLLASTVDRAVFGTLVVPGLGVGGL
ncbi:lysoplasmalogenase [Myxococcota bacterium]|nr:lysoplasmalogenase [Myxococcota bacterium]